MILWILIIILFLFFLVFIFIPPRRRPLNEQLRKDIKTAAAQINQSYEDYIKQNTNERIKEIEEQYNNKKKIIEDQLKLLDENLEKAKIRQENQLSELEQKTAEIVNNRSKIEAAQIQSIVEYYQSQQLQIQEDFDAFKENIEDKKKKIQEELKEEEQKQFEIIEQYKRDEEIKKNKDFYRVVISENDKADIKKLKGIAEELHEPSVLYKLIYKTYYERPFNEMVGRVVKGCGGIGIYKITNLENGRVYIGQTKQNFKERWRTHVKRGIRAEAGTSNKLYTAMWEDGIENFTFEVLSECSAAELNKKEKEFINFIMRILGAIIVIKGQDNLIIFYKNILNILLNFINSFFYDKNQMKKYNKPHYKREVLFSIGRLKPINLL